MENENKNQNNEGQQPQKKNSFVRTGLVCLLTIIVLVLIFWVFASQSRGEEITITDFMAELDAGHIERVELNAKEINKTKDKTNKIG